MWDLDVAIILAGLLIHIAVRNATEQLKFWAEHQQRILQTEVEGIVREAAAAIIQQTHPTYRDYPGWKG